jgi:hypothetical protein
MKIFKPITESWWFWLLVIALIFVRGWQREWDVTNWCLLGYFAITGVFRFLSRRRKATGDVLIQQ